MINDDDLDFKGKTDIKTGDIQKANNSNTYSNSRSVSSYSIFKIIILIAIAFILIRILFSGNNQVFNFQSFLEQLQSMPQISTSFKSFFERTIVTDWGWFNFFRDFINSLMSIISILAWLFGALLDVVRFIVSFLKMLFV